MTNKQTLLNGLLEKKISFFLFKEDKETLSFLKDEQIPSFSFVENSLGAYFTDENGKACFPEFVSPLEQFKILAEKSTRVILNNANELPVDVLLNLIGRIDLNPEENKQFVCVINREKDMPYKELNKALLNRLAPFVTR